MKREITFKPYKKQFQALQLLRDNVTNEVLYGGGARGAKSYLGCAWVIINAYSMPGSAGLIGRNELKRLKATTLITFYEVANSFNLKQGQDFNYNAQDSIITFKNGSMVFLIDLSYMPSDPNYDRLGSYGITYAFIDEAQEISEQAINVLKGRYSKLQGDGWKTIPKALYTCNPAKNWIYREFYLPYKNGTIRSDRAFVPSLVTDNPSIAPEYIENLRKADNVTVQRLLYGNFEYDDSPGRLFDYDKIVSSFSPKTAYNNRRYISCDAARKGKDKAVIFVWEGFNIIDYTIFDTCKTTEITHEIRYYQNKYKIDNQRTIVDEDGVGCLLPGTEVFLKRGWTNAEDVKKGDLIYSKDFEGNVFFDTVSDNIIKYEQKVFKNEDMGFGAGHFTPIKTRNEYEFKNLSFDYSLGFERVIFDNEFKWKGIDTDFVIPIHELIMPHGGVKIIKEEQRIRQKWFNAFLGWYCSEGNLDGYANKYYINISQSEKSVYNQNIVDILNNCGFKWSRTLSKAGEYKYIFADKFLFNWIKENCYSSEIKNSHHKKTPDYVKNSTKENILSYLIAYNEGDGCLNRGKRYYATSSVVMKDDLLELIYKSGNYGNFMIKCKKGSKSSIHGREIIRKKDVYEVYETKNTIFGYRNKQFNESYETVYDIKLSGKSKLYPIRFTGGSIKGKMFWTHNGGVVDELGCLGFVNNSLPVNPYGAKHNDFLKRNFANLKTQCYFELARVVNDGICFFDVDMEIKSKLCEELDVVVQVDMDKDSKIRIISKEDVKEKIGRSPDYSDACMFRCYFNLVFEGVEEVPEDPKYKDKEFDMGGKKYTWKELMGEDVIENNEDSIF